MGNATETAINDTSSLPRMPLAEAVSELTGKLVSPHRLSKSTKHEAVDSTTTIQEVVSQYNILLQPYRLKLRHHHIAPDTINQLPDESIIIVDDMHVAILASSDGKALHLRNSNQQLRLPYDDALRLLSGHVLLLERETQAHQQSAQYSSHQPWLTSIKRSLRPVAVEVACCSLFINIFVFAVPLFTMNVYDRVVPNFALDTLYVLLAGVCLALLFDLLFKVIRLKHSQHSTKAVQLALESIMLGRITSPLYPQRKQTVGGQAVLFREAEMLCNFLLGRVMPTLIDIPFVFIFWAVIWAVAGSAVWVPVIGGLVILAVGIACNAPIKQINNEIHTHERHKTVKLIETITGQETIRLFHAGHFFHNMFKHASYSNAQFGERIEFYSQLSSVIAVVVMQLVSMLVVTFGVYHVHDGYMSVGAIIAVTILANRSMVPFIAIGATLSHGRQMWHSYRSIESVLNVKPYAIRPANEAMFRNTGALNAQQLVFRYHQQQPPVLQLAALTIQPGEKVGIIGRSGSGKSTLLRVLSGMEKHYNGSLKLHQHAMDTIPQDMLSRHIGLLQQENFFFEGTLRDNVTLGDASITEETLQQAYQLSGCTAMIAASGDKDQLHIHEHGHNLSGGQRQALALARIFAREHRILLLDEPTNGLDVSLEQQVKRNLKFFTEHKTMIIVTHRMNLLPLVDRLILVDSGRIIADGPRRDVLAKLREGGNQSAREVGDG